MTTAQGFVAKELKIPLPKAWNKHVKEAVLHVASLAHFTTARLQGQAANSQDWRIRRKANQFRLQRDHAMDIEQLRIVMTRLESIQPNRRPHYAPIERMAILELQASRAWSLKQTAKAFLVSVDTIASWKNRQKDDDDNLLQLREPVNKFPDLVRYTVQQLKTACPSLGKVKIAEILSRAGVHLAKTTIGRILKEDPVEDPNNNDSKKTSGDDEVDQVTLDSQERDVADVQGVTASEDTETEDTAGGEVEEQTEVKAKPVVTAKYRNHVWHIDLTVVPIQGGFWTSWLPFALPQCWPFCWWVAVIMDHHSRRCMGVTVFNKQPTSVHVRAFLGRAMHAADATPKYIISDKGCQFWPCKGYRQWCERRGIQPRFGAIGQHGSIAIVERFIKTLKDEATRRILVPHRREPFRGELILFRDWYNEHRPHMSLEHRTPNEVYFDRPAMNEQSRIEPRVKWPRGSPCAKPPTEIDGEPGDQFTLQIDYHKGRKHLPLVTLKRAA